MALSPCLCGDSWPLTKQGEQWACWSTAAAKGVGNSLGRSARASQSPPGAESPLALPFGTMCVSAHH